MRYNQLIFWFFSYSILIAGTAIAASAVISQKERKFLIVLRIDIALLVMVFAISLILFSYRDSSVSENETYYYFLQLLFFLGTASSAYFTLDLPEAFFPGRRKTSRSSILSISILAGFIGYLVSFSSVTFLFQNQAFLVIVAGIFGLLIFFLFSLSSIAVLVDFFRKWTGASKKIKIVLMIACVLFVLSVFLIDVIYGLYFKLRFHRELTLFYVLPFYSIIVCSALTLFILKTANLKKRAARTLNSVKLANCGISPREMEVIRCLTDGMSYKEIADDLCISLSTVQSHVRSIYRKTMVNSKVELINFCSN